MKKYPSWQTLITGCPIYSHDLSVALWESRELGSDDSSCPSQSRHALQGCLSSAGQLSIANKPGTPIDHRGHFTSGRYECMLEWSF